MRDREWQLLATVTEEFQRAAKTLGSRVSLSKPLSKAEGNPSIQASLETSVTATHQKLFLWRSDFPGYARAYARLVGALTPEGAACCSPTCATLPAGVSHYEEQSCQTPVLREPAALTRLLSGQSQLISNQSIIFFKSQSWIRRQSLH